MNEQKPVSLIDISAYLPGEPIGADYYAQFAESNDLRDNMMSQTPRTTWPRTRPRSCMVERATGLIERHGRDPAQADVLITHTQLPDMPLYGGGAGMADRLGMKELVRTCLAAVVPRSCWG